MEKIYLSGPMTGLTVEEATTRRSFYFKNLSDCFELVSPMRDWHLMTNQQDRQFILEEIRPHSNDKNKNNVSFCSDKEIMNRDRFDVIMSDGMILDLLGATRPSIGAVAELCWAYEFNKPVVLVMEDEGNVNEHAFINEMSSFRVNSRERACEIIRSVFNKKPKMKDEKFDHGKTFEEVWKEHNKQKELEEAFKKYNEQKEKPMDPWWVPRPCPLVPVVPRHYNQY